MTGSTETHVHIQGPVPYLGEENHPLQPARALPARKQASKGKAVLTSKE